MLGKFRRPRVFVLEDSEALRKQIVHCVKEAGEFDIVGEGGSVRQSIVEIRRLRPEILILDLQLSDGTGWEVIDALDMREFKTIILTNSADPVSRAAAAERRIQRFFDKTTQFDEFLDWLSVLAAGA